jgi:ubiquinone/menaquinone biosynthesis C-methylase UbiE
LTPAPVEEGQAGQAPSPPVSPQTELARARYNRVAPSYDQREAWMERRAFDAWRRRLWPRVRGPRVLEVGVGTGKNMPYYPPGMQITAIDLSPGMLAEARRRTEQLGLAVDLREMDVEHLDFPDASFDTAAATWVFCTVPRPVQGLREVRRVVRPGGQILLLEHMRAENPILGALMDIANALVTRQASENINRRTLDNIRMAGLKIVDVERLSAFGIFLLIEARP